MKIKTGKRKTTVSRSVIRKAVAKSKKMNKAKIGIVVDNYKLKKYKEALNESNFTDYYVSKFKKSTSTIRVNVDSIDVGAIKKICEELELHFKAVKN